MPRVLFAKAIKKQGNLIQRSDYVFKKKESPANDDDKPQNIYGYSKLKAEESIQKLLRLAKEMGLF